MPGMDGFISFNGTLQGGIEGGGGGDVTDVKVRDSQETTFESVVNEEGVAEIDLISYVRRNELSQELIRLENDINTELQRKENIINYSTQEQLTGRTLNGKPTYIKIFELSNMSPDTAYNLAENIEDIILHDICAIDNRGAKWYPSTISMYNYQGVGTYYVTVVLYPETHLLKATNQSRSNTIGMRAIIEYTKVED